MSLSLDDFELMFMVDLIMSLCYFILVLLFSADIESLNRLFWVLFPTILLFEWALEMALTPSPETPLVSPWE